MRLFTPRQEASLPSLHQVLVNTVAVCWVLWAWKQLLFSEIDFCVWGFSSVGKSSSTPEILIFIILAVSCRMPSEVKSAGYRSSLGSSGIVACGIVIGCLATQ